MLLISLLVSAVITIVFFEIMSWYHFGDVPTKEVMIRLIAFFCVLSGIIISIVALITKKENNKV